MEEIKEELGGMLQTHDAFTIPIGEGIAVPESVVGSWIVMLVLVLLARWATKHLELIPQSRRQIAVEWFVTFIDDFAKSIIGEHHGRRYTAFLGTLGLFLGLANISGLFGLVPPTKDINVAIGAAICSTIVIYGSQFREHGFKGGLKKFAEPSPLITPINVMEVVIRPMSLSMRLFGNVLAAFIIMEIIKIICGYVLPVPFSLYFDIFDGGIQAVVFVFLTTLFIAESVE